MSAQWPPDELALLDGAEELEIATTRLDGTTTRYVPVWVVCANGQAYVRTWHRRQQGWFGRAVATRHASIRVPGLERQVLVEDVGRTDAELRAQVDAAYRAKYDRHGASAVDRMAGDDAADATLRLVPAGDEAG